MKKIICTIFVLSVFIFCGPKQQQVEKYIEDGVEVVLNHLEPYRITGEPTSLTIEEEFTIDTEQDDIAELGLTDIWGFSVDSNDDIYFYSSPLAQGNLVRKFDRDGQFVHSFAPKGQGPGEIQNPAYLRIDSNDELAIIDTRGHKLSIFDTGGNCLNEFPVDRDLARPGTAMIPLDNGNYLIRRVILADPKYSDIVVSLFDSEFVEIKELHRHRVESPEFSGKFQLPIPIPLFEASDEHIFVGNGQLGYEIFVFDLDGNFIRKIRKEYEQVEISEEYKNEVKGFLKDSEFLFLKDIVFFPKYWPPFQFLFTDDEGRLFVMTHEKGENAVEHVFDVFNHEGVLVSRKSLDVFLSGSLFEPGNPIDSWAVMKHGRFYCLSEKKSGFKELVVYRTKWE
jgi:hypothetical protein